MSSENRKSICSFTTVKTVKRVKVQIAAEDFRELEVDEEYDEIVDRDFIKQVRERASSKPGDDVYCVSYRYTPTGHYVNTEWEIVSG